MTPLFRLLLLLSLLFVQSCQCINPKPLKLPAQNAIASAHPLATQAGMDILNHGGNAFDAAVAVAAVLGVVEPYSAGLGGGGFWLLHRASDNQNIFVDAREKAPLASHRDMFIDSSGKVDRDKATNGPLSSAIPGQPAAFDHLAKHYGNLSLQQTLQAAIDYAKNGFPVDPIYLKRINYRQAVLQRFADSQQIFLKNNKTLTLDDTIIQPDLAITLSRLAEHGANGFYQGPTAEKLVEGVQAAGGIWQLDDLTQYQIKERQPIEFNFGGVHIVSAPPPSSGGIALSEMFGMLRHYDSAKLDDTTQTHLLIEVMRRAYRDRAEHLGDSDFYPVPIEKLTSPIHHQQLADSINTNKATASTDLGTPRDHHSGPHTTHFSVIDQQGNYVAATLSINLPFGSGFTVPGTGVLLNNEMDDFSAKPGSPNAFGLVGSEANAIAPSKRPLSSMTPTFAEFTLNNEQQVAIIGTPGGSRIITMVLLGLLEALDHQPPSAWVSRPRFHHQYLPDQIQFEPGALNVQQQEQLKQLGHSLKPLTDTYGNMQALRWNVAQGTVEAASDPRGIGQAIIAPTQIESNNK